MKLFVSLFFIFLLSFSAQAKTIDLEEIERRMKSAIGMVAVSSFGKNVLGTGFFISDKLFYTDFITVEQLRRSSNTKITIWIGNQYFAVKRAYVLDGARNLAVLEIESSYNGGTLRLSKEGTPTNVMYGAGFDIGAIQASGRYITGQEILSGLREGRASRFDSADFLSIMPVRSYHRLSDYQFFQLTGKNMHTSTNGLPFLNQQGEVIGMKFGNAFNLAFATPVKFLKEEGNCGELSIQDCLDKAVEELYEQAKSGDPIAQYAHNNRMYMAYLDEAILRGNEAIDLLLASAKAGNVLSQLQTMIHITSQYQCFALPEEQEKGGIFSKLAGLLHAVDRMFTDKAEVLKLTADWLGDMERKDFVLSYFLKGLMFLNGNCVEQDIPTAMFYLNRASQRGFTPIDYIVIKTD